MDSRYTAVILAVLVAAAEAGSFAKTLNPALHRLVDNYSKNDNWDGLGIQADVNHYIDQTVGMLVPFIEQHGLDPMNLPDITEGFSVRPLLVTYSAWLSLHDGTVTGLVNIARHGHQRVHYFANMLRLRLEFEFTDLEFVYRYLVTVMNIGPRGGIVGSLNRFTIVFDLLIDFNNDELHLQEFSINDVGRLRVRLTGNILTDWLINPVIGVFTSIFDNTIMRIVESNIRGSVQDALDFVNTNVREVVGQLESYGQ